MRNEKWENSEEDSLLHFSMISVVETVELEWDVRRLNQELMPRDIIDFSSFMA